MKRFSTLVPTGLLVVLIGSAAAIAACGQDVEVGENAGPGGGTASSTTVSATSGAPGTGGATASSATTVGATSGGPGTGGATASSVASSGVGSSSVSSVSSVASSGDTSSASTGGGSMCGGLAGVQCPAGQYCDYPDDHCGQGDSAGTCRVRVELPCPAIYAPVCGCDGTVYPSGCALTSSGVDASNLGGCKDPAGMYACGSGFCNIGTEYCTRDVSDTGMPDVFSCHAVPTACPASPSCDCLGATCSNLCAATSDGGLLVTCPGG